MRLEVCLHYLCWLPFCISQLTWEKLPVRLGGSYPQARRDTGLGYDKNHQILVLFGGRTATRILNDTWIYNISSEIWREVFGKISPSGRFGFVSGVTHGKFYVTTGQGRDNVFYNDIWAYTFSTEVWQQLPMQPKPSYFSLSEWNGISHREYNPKPRYGAVGGIFPDSTHLYITLGFSSEMNYFDTAAYDILETSWQSEYPCYGCNPYSTLYPHPRVFHSGTMIERDELVIFGGCLSGEGTGGPCPSGDSWLFDGKTKTWTQLKNCLPSSVHTSMAMLPIRDGERRVVLYGGNQEARQVLQTTPLGFDHVGILNPGSEEWTIRKTQALEDLYPTKRAAVSMVTGDFGIYMFGGFEVDSGALQNELWILRGDSVQADNAPQVECSSRFFNLIMTHGILMIIGWGIFLQWGAFVARYAKTRGPLWFYIHISMQVFGLLCGIAGFVCAILSVRTNHFHFGHGILGLIITILGILQPMNGALKPDTNKYLVGNDKSVVRRIWEFIHHWFGRLTLVLALINITLGIFLAVSDPVIWILWLVYFGLLLLVYLVIEGLYQQNHQTSLTESRFSHCKVDEIDQNGVGRSPVTPNHQPQQISHL